MVCLKQTEASHILSLFPVLLGVGGSLESVWYHFQPRLVFILLRSEETKVRNLKNKALPALSLLGMPCRSSQLWFGAVCSAGINKSAPKKSDKRIILSLTFFSGLVEPLMHLQWEARHVSGRTYFQADLHHRALCSHIGLVHLVFCTSVPLSRGWPAHAGRVGRGHCCVFKNSLQAAFQITSAAN